MAGVDSGPARYSFKVEERGVADTLLEALRHIRTRASLSAYHVHLCGVLQLALERLPLVTANVGLSVALVNRQLGGNWDYQDVRIDDECVEFTTGESIRGPDGFEHSSRLLLKVGVGWREGEADLVELEDWAAALVRRAQNAGAEVSFEDFGDSAPDWREGPSTGAHWNELESDFA